MYNLFSTVVDSLQATSKMKSADKSTYFQEMLQFLTNTSSSTRKYRRRISERYLLSNKCILRLLDVWLNTCSNLVFINLIDLKRSHPYAAAEYLQSIKLQVMSAQDILQKTYVICIIYFILFLFVFLIVFKLTISCSDLTLHLLLFLSLVYLF